MRQYVRYAAVFVCAVLLSLAASSYTDEQLSASRVLYDIGMMKGSGGAFSAEAMNLDGGTTRAELAVTITRLLGKESKAKYQQNPHPFTDVPDWASDYVGYLYENYLVNGTSDTTFGSDEPASVKQFCTMLLRVLGYDDAAGDFLYDDAPAFAVSLGIIDDDTASKDGLIRGDMMTACLNALHTNLKRSSRTLSRKLYDERIFDEPTLTVLDLADSDALERYFSTADPTLCTLTLLRDTAGRIVLIPDHMIGDYGLRVFYTADEHPTPTELPQYAENRTDMPSASKGKQYYPDDSGASYIKELYVYGLADMTNVRLMLVLTSSEGDSYQIVSRTASVPAPGAPISGTVLYERYHDQPVTLAGAKAAYDGTDLVVTFADKIDEYGVHVFYTSADEVIPKEIKQTGNVRFVKGKPIYVSGSAQTYMDSLRIEGLSDTENLRLIVIMANSEADVYEISGRSDIIELP